MIQYKLTLYVKVVTVRSKEQPCPPLFSRAEGGMWEGGGGGADGVPLPPVPRWEQLTPHSHVPPCPQIATIIVDHFVGAMRES